MRLACGTDATLLAGSQPPGVTDDRPERPPVANFLDALDVPRNAKIGVAVGLLFTLAVYGFFVVVPAVFESVPDREQSSVLFLVLAFTIAVSAAMLVTLALTIRSAVRLHRETAADEPWTEAVDEE